MVVVLWLLVTLTTCGALALLGLLAAQLVSTVRGRLGDRRRARYLEKLFNGSKQVIYRPCRATADLSTATIVREANARGYRFVEAAATEGSRMLKFERNA